MYVGNFLVEFSMSFCVSFCGKLFAKVLFVKFDNSRKMAIFAIRTVFYEKTLSPLYPRIPLSGFMRRILLRRQSAGDS